MVNPFATRYKRPRRASQRNHHVRNAALLVLAFVFAAGFGHGLKKLQEANTTPPQGPAKLSYAARQVNDVILVAGAVGQYASANGALPVQLSVASDGGLVLCGAACDVPGQEVSGMSVYRPAGVQLIGYRAALTAPDLNTMYLVPGGTCTTNGSVGDPNTTPRSMVLLYATQSGGSNTPRCIAL